jgi:hypothetical protein
LHHFETLQWPNACIQPALSSLPALRVNPFSMRFLASNINAEGESTPSGGLAHSF